MTGLSHVDMSTISSIYDPLYCESNHDLDIPEWTEIVVDKETGETVYDLLVELKTITKNMPYIYDNITVPAGGIRLLP